MVKICTDINQSKKLLELGIDVNTADMYYSYDYNIDEYEDDAQIIPQSELGQHFSLFPEDIPAWSLSALLGILPSVIKRKEKRMFLTLEKAGAYNLYYKSPDRLDELWETKEELVDACYKMIINLHELKLL